jgi:hypothetical protein
VNTAGGLSFGWLGTVYQSEAFGVYVLIIVGMACRLYLLFTSTLHLPAFAPCLMSSIYLCYTCAPHHSCLLLHQTFKQHHKAHHDVKYILQIEDA